MNIRYPASALYVLFSAFRNVTGQDFGDNTVVGTNAGSAILGMEQYKPFDNTIIGVEAGELCGRKLSL